MRSAWATSVLAAVLLLAPAPALAQGTAASGGDNAPKAGKLTKSPRLLNFKEVEAAYPESEKASGRTAAVLLQLAITDRGDVSEVVVMESAGPAFDSAAVEAAKRFK